MIRIEQIKALPADAEKALSAYAKSEWEKFGDKGNLILAANDCVLLFRNAAGVPLMVIGFTRGTFLGNPPEVWIMLCDEFSAQPRRYAKAIRSYLGNMKQVWPKVVMKVEPKDTLCRFIRFFGFAKIGEDENYLHFGVN